MDRVKKIKAKETKAFGCRFRSRLEARWACVFEHLGIKWDYELEGFDLPSGSYLPDFWLPQVEMWVEVKPKFPTPHELTLCVQLACMTGNKVLILDGVPAATMLFRPSTTSWNRIGIGRMRRDSIGRTAGRHLNERAALIRANVLPSGIAGTSRGITRRTCESCEPLPSVRPTPECHSCYADQLSKRNPKTLGIWGNDGVRVVAAPAYWQEPIKWNAAAEAAGERRRVFCASLADVFEDWEGDMHDHKGNRLPLTMADVRRDLFKLIDDTPHLDWLLLTKRPQNIRRMWVQPREVGTHRPLAMARENVWLGTSAGTQQSADKFVPELLKCRDLAPVLFVSCEPMLDPVDFKAFGVYWRKKPCSEHERFNLECPKCNGKNADRVRGIDWLILGVESNGQGLGRLGAFGHEDSWLGHAEQLVREALQFGVVPFVKQLPINGKLSHDMAEWPEALRVQEFPRRQIQGAKRVEATE